MPIYRRLAGRIAVGLLFIVVTSACSLGGPDLRIAIDNTEGPKDVAVTVDSSGPGTTGSEAVTVPHGQGAEWSVPLGSTWEVKVDGDHVIGSGDRTDPALPSPDQGQDVVITIRVTDDGTVRLVDAR